MIFFVLEIRTGLASVFLLLVLRKCGAFLIQEIIVVLLWKKSNIIIYVWERETLQYNIVKISYLKLRIISDKAAYVKQQIKYNASTIDSTNLLL